MLKLNKKGFTIVELVIVIAVVAILAAVLIPTFIGLMQTAKTSADIQLVTSLNKVMAMQEALDGKNGTMYNALQDAKANGYDLSKLTPTSEGNDIVWDQSTDRFALVNPKAATDRILFWDESLTKPSVDSNNIYKLWKIYTEMPGEQTYSIYWAGTTAPNLTEKTLTVGFDAGECSGISALSYVRAGTETAQEVIFRTNGGNLTVDAGKDTVKHYGEVNNVTITAVAGDSYHEFGKVSGKIKITAGRFVDETGMISNITVLGAGVKIDTTRTDLLVINFDGNVARVTLNNTEITKDDRSSILAVKDGKKETATIVTTDQELRDAIYDLGGNIVLGADITTRSSLMLRTKYHATLKGSSSVSLNLNGHTLTYDSSSRYLFALAYDVQLTIEGSGKIETTKDAPAFSVQSSAKLIINGGEFIANGNSSKSPLISISSSEGQGNVIINNGRFVSNEVCIGMYKNAVVEINGGEFTSKDNFVIGTNGSAENGNNTITINGGTFNITNGVGILVRSGKATIGKDVVIHATGTTAGKIGDSSVNLSAPAAIVRDEKSDYPGGAPTIVNNSAYEVVDISKK